jgi:hypothetical protein
MTHIEAIEQIRDGITSLLATIGKDHEYYDTIADKNERLKPRVCLDQIRTQVQILRAGAKLTEKAKLFTICDKLLKL